MAEMRKEKCQQIKAHVFENVAPMQQGKVSLNDVYRMFSHLGSRSEIEKCLDELVGSNRAQKVEVNQGVHYIFQEIALKYGKKWKDEVENLKEQASELESEVTSLKMMLEANEKMMDIWLEGWRDVLKDADVYSSVSNYLSCVFFGQRLKRILDELKDKGKALRVICMKTKEGERKLAASYEV